MSQYYEVKVRGHLDEIWKEWFENIKICKLPDGNTSLLGYLDQAALHGLLSKISNLGLPLVSVNPAPEHQAEP